MDSGIVKTQVLILSLLIAGGNFSWAEKDKQEKGKLVVKNADFSDLVGLQELPNGWYAGLPQGWSGLLSNTYNIWTDGQGNWIANVETMSQVSPKFTAFTQEVGMVSVSSMVTLTFEVLNPWNQSTFELGAAIYDAITDVPLGKAGSLEIVKPGTYSVKAEIVPAGTRVKIGFWAATGTPGIDNVKVEAKPLP